MVPLIVLVVVLAVGGGIAFLVKSRHAATAASNEAGTGPNEFLQSPPTSFPGSSATRSLEAAPEPDAEPAAESGSDKVELAVVDDDQDADDEDDEDDEIAVARFKAPGERSIGATGPAKPLVAPAVYHLEGPPVVPEPVAELALEPVPEPIAELVPEPTVELAPEPVAELVPEPAVELAPEPVPEPEPALELELEVEPAAEEPVAPILALVVDDDAVAADGPVIDLLGDEAVVMPAEAAAGRPGDDEAWDDVVLQSEPDAVDHVLEALINRARFKQVEVEAVATELVERADLQGQEVSEVLAELVGRADDTTLDAARTSELTLFNDEVPSRPGQLTDFARLAPSEKKRIIVRVLCLLVARSEDQQLPPRMEGDSAEPRSWPLARAVWPLAVSDDDGEAQLPNRRLAKSG